MSLTASTLASSTTPHFETVTFAKGFPKACSATVARLSPMVLATAKKGDAEEDADTSKLQAKTFSGLEMRGIGPALMSGRIADIAIHPKDQSTWYVAVGSGHVWKTVNAGTTWEPIFDGDDVIGFVTSGGYSHDSQRSVALGLIPRERVADGAEFDIGILGDRRRATIHTTPLVDADGTRMRG